QIAGDEAGKAARLLVGVLEPADRLDAALVVTQPRRRRHDAARRALEQLHAERALDRGDMLRDAGLGGVLARRSTCERALLAHGDDGAYLAQRDVSHRNVLSRKLMPQLEIYYFGRRGHKARIPVEFSVRIRQMSARAAKQITAPQGLREDQHGHGKF